MIAQTKHKRAAELDFFKGVAVILMIFYHLLYALDYYEVINIDFNSILLVAAARFVQFTFLITLGISLFFSRSHVKTFPMFLKRSFFRFFYIGCAAASVSLVSYIVIADDFVRFGILHMIALSLLICSFFVRRPLLSGIIALTIWLLTPFVEKIFFDNYLGYLLGLANSLSYYAVDYFSLFPWLSLPFLGISLAHIFYKNGVKGRFDFLTKFKAVIFLGKHPLFIYLIHVPIIFLLVQSYKMLISG